MIDDPILALERELVGAAQRRQAQPVTDGAWPSPRQSRRRAGAGALALVASVVIVGLVATAALVGLHGHTRAPAPAKPVRPAQQPSLRDSLSVLRRPQTAADRQAVGLLPHPEAFGRLQPATVRVAARAPWGSPIVLAVFHATGADPGGLVVDAGGSATSCCGVRAPSIAADGLEMTSNAGRTVGSGPATTSTETRMIVVVPDGVAAVRIVFPAQEQPGQPRFRTSLSTGPVRVRGNVAAIQVHRRCCGDPPEILWYAAGGRLLKRTGYVAPILHLTASPRPGPATPLSRRALGDPATPNPVTVAPAVGTAKTLFSFSFKVLVTGASYYEYLTGPPGCVVTLNGVSSVGGGPTDVRGLTYAVRALMPVATARCAGTWRMALSLALPGHPPASRPFGSATVTVRP